MWTAGITARAPSVWTSIWRRCSPQTPTSSSCSATPGADAAREQVEELYGDNAVWQSLKAVQNDKVYYLEKTLFHNKPNSRFAEAYQKLAEILYPDVEFSFQASN